MITEVWATTKNLGKRKSKVYLPIWGHSITGRCLFYLIPESKHRVKNFEEAAKCSKLNKKIKLQRDINETEITDHLIESKIRITNCSPRSGGQWMNWVRISTKRKHKNIPNRNHEAEKLNITELKISIQQQTGWNGRKNPWTWK